MLTYLRLREIQKKEMESLEPVKLEKEFYSELRQFLEAKRESALKSKSLMEMREFENAEKVAKNIVSKRKEKLLVLSAIAEQSIEGLTDEENKCLDDLRRVLDASFGPISGIFEDQHESRMETSKVKIVKAIDAYKGFDNNIYGPFKEGEEITLPEEEAGWLLKSKMAEHIS